MFGVQNIWEENWVIFTKTAVESKAQRPRVFKTWMVCYLAEVGVVLARTLGKVLDSLLVALLGGIHPTINLFKHT